MTELHALRAYSGNTLVGVLTYDSIEDQFGFEYDDNWRKNPRAFPLSPHLPLQKLSNQSMGSGAIKRFLENLLPEGKAREIAATTYQISKANLYALLCHLGRETTGAISLLPEATEPQQQPITKRKIPLEELHQRIQERKQYSFSVWDGRVPASIAGYQDKLPLFVEGEALADGLCLMDGQLASTHILKPEPGEGRLKCLVANEHFCMKLAAAVKLPVAAVSILRTPLVLLAVERFDRVRTTESVRKVHIIDGCQALDLPVTHKYERNLGSGPEVSHIRDGVSFEKLFALARNSANKAFTEWHLMRWALFQYLIGNGDGHGKNVSFFCHANGLDLAPFYDLVSIVPYTDADYEPPMGIGDEFSLRELSSSAWTEFARLCGIDRRLLASEMKEFSKLASREASKLATDIVYVDDERPIVASIASFVAKQGERLSAAAVDVLKGAK
ncbi:MAG: HipA domain-containing protein [Pseudomonadota bacterium]